MSGPPLFLLAPLGNRVTGAPPAQQPPAVRVAVAPVGQEAFLAAYAADRRRPGTPPVSRSSIASSWDVSLRYPAVTRTESGRPLPSQERCSLVEKPPGLRPSASSLRCDTPFCVRAARQATRPRGVLVRPHAAAVHAHQPLHLAVCVALGLRVG